MLTLYSFGPGANSLKPMATLYEKELDFKLHFVDPAKFEQHSDWFKKINPRGQVPALDHDGRIITESTVICEYLEDVFPDQHPLRPADPYWRAQMRVWTKWVDEYFCWCVSTIGWHYGIRPIAQSMTDEAFEVYVAEFERTGFTGGLNRYRNVDRDWEDLSVLRGRAIDVPALFIGGDRDGPTIWGKPAIDRFTETLPRLYRSVILSGCGHWTQQERADDVSALLVEFLRHLDRA